MMQTLGGCLKIKFIYNTIVDGDHFVTAPFYNRDLNREVRCETSREKRHI